MGDPQRADRAKSSVPTWMRSTPRSNSGIIRSYAASRSQLAERRPAVSSEWPTTKPEVRGALDHAVGHGQAKCPDLIFVPPRFDTYKAISLRIRDIVAEYTLIIEHLSLDEAYLERSAQSDDRDP